MSSAALCGLRACSPIARTTVLLTRPDKAGIGSQLKIGVLVLEAGVHVSKANADSVIYFMLSYKLTKSHDDKDVLGIRTESNRL